MEKNKRNILIILMMLLFTIIGFIIGFMVSELQNSNNGNQEAPSIDDNDSNQEMPNTNEDETLINDLYSKYIYYNEYETSDYENINVNDNNSDVYLVKFAIYKILEENSIDINNYSWGHEEDLNGYSNGYVITTGQINECIKKYFNIERTIDFENLEFYFSLSSNISQHYFKDEMIYRLIADDSIPKTGGMGKIIHSKLDKYEKVDNNIIIYTEYLLMGYDMEVIYLNDSADNMDIIQYYIDASICNWELDKECILNNNSDKIGKFKHTFTKAENGNYYWVSTEKIN